MDMRAVPNPFSPAAHCKEGQGKWAPDLPVLLAVLAARQSAGLTARRVREGNPPDLAGDEPARMAEIFAPVMVGQAAPDGAAGSFNAGVAHKLAMGADGEVGVYSGT